MRGKTPRGAILAILFCWSAAGTFAAEASDSEAAALAILLEGGAGQAPTLLEAELLEQLAPLEGFELVERETVRRALEELELSASGLVAPEKALRLGMLIAADWLLLIEREAKPAPGLLRARLLETRTGIRLLDKLYPLRDAQKPPTAKLVAALRSALRTAQRPAEERRYVGVLGFRSEEPGAALRPIAQALAVFLQNDLQRLPGVVVLEREDFRRLTAEHDVSGLKLKPRAAAVLIDGGVRGGGDGKRLAVTLRLVRPGGQTRAVEVAVPKNNVAAMRAAILKAIASELDAGNAASAGDSKVEAELLAQRCRWLLRRRRGDDFYDVSLTENILSLAEAAFALAPSFEHRELVVIAHREIGKIGKGSLLERLQHDVRAHQINLAGLRARTKPMDYRNILMFRSSARNAAYGKLCKGPLSIAERRAMDQITQLIRQEHSVAQAEARRTGHEELTLLRYRLSGIAKEAGSPEEFMELARSIHREMATLAERTVWQTKPASKWSTLRRALAYYDLLDGGATAAPPKPMVWYALGVRGAMNFAPNSEHGRGWSLAQLRPLIDWLLERDAPAPRMAGYYVLARQKGAAGRAAAEKMFDILFDEVAAEPIRHPLSMANLIRETMRDYIRGSDDDASGARDALDYFEARVRQAEKARDATRWLRVNKIFWSQHHIPSWVKQWRTRILALVEAKAYDPAVADVAERLRSRTAALRRILNTPSYTIGGPWIEYDVTSIPLHERGPEHRRLEYVHIDGHQKGRGDEMPLLLFWIGYRTNKNGKTHYFHTVMRQGLDGAARIVAQASRMGAPVSVAPGPDGAIYVAGYEAGLTVIREGKARHFGDEEGIPAEAIQQIAWLGDRLYLAFPNALCSFDPETRAFATLATSKAIEPRGPLDGGRDYLVKSVLADPVRKCLWLSVKGTPEGSGIKGTAERSGIWKFTPRDGRFKQVFQDQLGMLAWSDGKIAFLVTRHVPFSGGLGSVKAPFFLLDTDTLEAERLTGMSRFTVNGGPVNPSRKRWLLLNDRVFSGGYFTREMAKDIGPPSNYDGGRLAGWGAASSPSAR